MGPRRYRRGWTDVLCIAPLAIVLQWGRDVIVADGRAASARPRCCLWLQWGRDVIVADGRSAPRPRSRRSRAAGLRFNGAATLSSRMDAEHEAQLLREQASMGPRRYRRGWLLASRSGFVERRRSGGFNGAATLSSRMGQQAGQRPPRAGASMGPRRYRGWSRLQICALFALARLQWGRDVIVADGFLTEHQQFR